MVLFENGELFAWGCAVFGQIGTGNTQNALGPVQVFPPNEKTCRFINIDCGKRHSLAVDS